MSTPWGYHRRGEHGPRGRLARWWYRRRVTQVRRWQDETRPPTSPTAPVRMDALSIVVSELAKEHGCFVQDIALVGRRSVPAPFEACQDCAQRGRRLVEALRREECLPSRPTDA